MSRHNKIHSVTSLLFQIRNAYTENVLNVLFPMPELKAPVKTGYLLLEQKKFQNNQKNNYKVYQLVFFRCIMILSYRVTFLCNGLGKFIIHQKALYGIFLCKKSCKVVYM